MLYRTRQLRQERRLRFEALRRLHRPPQERRFGWTQGVGIVLMGVAVLAALDPDYPIPRELARTASASTRVYLLPEGRSPDGEAPIEAWRFGWSWTGPEVVWELVLLGSDFVRCGAMSEIRGSEVEVTAAIADLLRSGRARYWFVAAELEGVPFRSMPLLLPPVASAATPEPAWPALPIEPGADPAAPR